MILKKIVMSLPCLFFLNIVGFGKQNTSDSNQEKLAKKVEKLTDSSSDEIPTPKKIKITKAQKKRIQAFRKIHHVDTLDKLLACAATHIERQFGKDASPRYGLEVLHEIKKMAEEGNKNYEPLKTACKAKLKQFEQNKKAHPIEYFSPEEKDNYVAELRKSYGEESKLVDLAIRAINPYAVCTTKFSFQFNAGLLVSMGIGMSRYLCQTPLGREFNMTGPSFGVGVGVGVNFELGTSAGKDKYRFHAPLAFLDGSVKLYSSLSHSVAFIGGFGSEWDPDAFDFNQERIKFVKGDIGLGEHGLIKGDFVVRSSHKGDFCELYDALGLDLEEGLHPHSF